MDLKRAIEMTEKAFLVLIAVFTVVAMVRLIILQGKDTDPSVLLYESGAILLICLAGWVVTRIPQDD